MGLLLLGLSRAPGWRTVRIFALIALTASAYSAANTFFALPGFSDAAVIAASRFNYFAGSIHCAAWLLYTFGGPTASLRALSRPVQGVALLLTVGGTVCLLTGWHVNPGIWNDLTIGWAHVSYRSPTLKPWAEWYGLAMVMSLLLPFGEYIRRALRGVSGSISHLAGFAIFFACAVVEMLVANRVINTFYLADIGFLAVVMPVAIATVRRVVSDADRLDALSRQLAGEVESRTEQLDRAEVALVESERHAALGRLAAGVGHEINNPLSYLQLSLDTLQEWADRTPLPADVQEAVSNARDGSERIRQVVEELRDYTHAPTGDERPLRPADVVRSALRVAEHQLHHVARLISSIDDTAMVRGDEARLVQVIVNLLTNAGQAINESPRTTDATITVRVYQPSSESVAIEVIDTGKGIAPEHVPLLTQPYFTTRADTGGTGLGLYISRGIVEQHHGRLEVESALGVGTTARVLLPAVARDAAHPDELVDEHNDTHGASLPVEPHAAAPRAAASDALAASNPVPEFARRPRVLIVDDEPILARGLARALAPYCDVGIANSGDEGMARVTDESAPVDAVVCDVMMPGMSGIEFADALAERDPVLRQHTLFMTGGAVTPAAIAFLERPDVRSVHKPIGGSELAAEISRLLATHQA